MAVLLNKQPKTGDSSEVSPGPSPRRRGRRPASPHAPRGGPEVIPTAAARPGRPAPRRVQKPPRQSQGDGVPTPPPAPTAEPPPAPVPAARDTPPATAGPGNRTRPLEPNLNDPAGVAIMNRQAAVIENVFFPAQALAGLSLDESASIIAMRLFLIRFR